MMSNAFPAGVVIERTSSSEDLDRVAALEAESFTNPWTREMLGRELQESNVARVYVLRLPTEPVAAFCACWLLFEELHVNTIAVRPGFRRQGLASLLMTHLLQQAAAEGAHRAVLEVRRSNAPAIQLYERLGFHIAGVRRNYYSHPEEDALLLTRDALPETPESC
jgi:ribosomal-protein-alanine N-acetyltransferase